MPASCEACGDEYTSFEQACETMGVDVHRTPLADYGFDINVIQHRPTSKGLDPYVMGCDIPILGERYLSLKKAGATETRVFQELHAAIEHYATTDVIPLFELDDRRPFDQLVQSDSLSS